MRTRIARYGICRWFIIGAMLAALFLSCEFPDMYDVDIYVWISKGPVVLNIEVGLWDGYGNSKVGEAVVMINDTIMSKGGSDDHGVIFHEPPGFTIDDGDEITLSITGGDLSVHQTYTMPFRPGSPSLLNPSPIDPSQPQPVSWTPAIPAPPQIQVEILYLDPDNPPIGYGDRYFLPGTTSEFTIPAGVFPNNTTGNVFVKSYSSGELTGTNVSSDSYYEVLNFNFVASFATIP